MVARSVIPARVLARGQERAEMHPALAAHLLEPFEFGQRIGVIVDAQVEIGPLLLAMNQQRRRLLAALVAARGLAGLHGCDQPLRKGKAGIGDKGLRGLVEHGCARQHVAGDGKAIAPEHGRTSRRIHCR